MWLVTHAIAGCIGFMISALMVAAKEDEYLREKERTFKWEEEE